MPPERAHPPTLPHDGNSPLKLAAQVMGVAVRVMAATRRRLAATVAPGLFRAEL